MVVLGSLGSLQAKDRSNELMRVSIPLPKRLTKFEVHVRS